MSHKIISNFKGGMTFETDMDGHKVIVDADPQFGGENHGPLPKPLVLTSLSGCTGMDVVSLLKKMRVEFADFNIEIEGELTDEHPKYYHTVSVEYHIYGDNLDEDKIKKAVDLSIEKYCGVMEMFRQFSEVKTSIHYHNA